MQLEYLREERADSGKGTEPMRRDKQVERSFMRHLLHDKTANTLALSAAAMVPLMAMVGGGVDASRYYMAAARLQAACDAGALAARQSMTNNTLTAANRQIGLTFFDQNFNDGIFGTTGRTREYTANASGAVIGTASATMPATIMQAFGFNNFPLQATCSAEVNISNSDIMFVLDVTGSMAECPDNSPCGSGPGSKIVALRQAVMNFYDTVQSSSSPTAQVRYGVVPYSQAVNVGFSLPRQHLANIHRYQSRVARFDPPEFPNNRAGDRIVLTDRVEWLPRSTSNFNSTTVDHYRFRTDGSAGTSAQAACAAYEGTTRNLTINGQSQIWEIFGPMEFVTGQWSGGPSNNRAGCRGRVRKTRVLSTADISPRFREWVYCQVTTNRTAPCGVTNPAGSPPGWDTVSFSAIYTLANNTINLPIGANGAMAPVTWPGCIEEAETVQTDNYDPIPANAHDLNINLVPTTDAQRWKPALHSAVWLRPDNAPVTTPSNLAQPTWACPRPAQRLSTLTRGELQSYVNGLSPAGWTYHDVGMLWGARFISPRGIFAAENTAAPNGDPIARHIVFMTDGEQRNVNDTYSTHGVELMDRRITGNGDATLEFNRRAARLQAICRAAQQENITVWVVAFGTELTQQLRNCASPGRAFQADDNATLNARFQEIAQKIAALRLTS